MNKIFLFGLLLLPTLALAEKRDTTYFNRAENKVLSLDSAYRYIVQKKDTTRIYLKNGSLVLESYYLKINEKKYLSVKAWRPNGTLKYQYLRKKWSSKYSCTTYWPNGKARFEESGSKKGLDKENCKAYTKLGVDTIYNNTTTGPEFPGGNKAESNFLNNNKIWNSSFKNDYITIRFIIEKDGRVSNVSLLKGFDPELDKEAIRIITELPKWTPAKFNGDTVRSIIEYIFITTVTSSEICKDVGYRRGINRCTFIDYED